MEERKEGGQWLWACWYVCTACYGASRMCCIAWGQGDDVAQQRFHCQALTGVFLAVQVDVEVMFVWFPLRLLKARTAYAPVCLAEMMPYCKVMHAWVSAPQGVWVCGVRRCAQQGFVLVSTQIEKGCMLQAEHCKLPTPMPLRHLTFASLSLQIVFTSAPFLLPFFVFQLKQLEQKNRL
eukprot:scaffold63436_cov19-Tisochrysis_lutea.AAC.1